jgi:hypothetical protein
LDCSMNLLSQVANEVKKVRVSCGAINMLNRITSYGVSQEPGGSPLLQQGGAGL